MVHVNARAFCDVTGSDNIVMCSSCQTDEDVTDLLGGWLMLQAVRMSYRLSLLDMLQVAAVTDLEVKVW